MNDIECVTFLQWALPRRRMRWAGFRKVRRQVCRRIDRRRAELGLADVTAYRTYLETKEHEWVILDQLCRITISRFYRDAGVFHGLVEEVLPQLARAGLAAGADRLSIWSAGCASGEEPYTLALAWRLRVQHRYPALSLQLLATDSDPDLLRRARAALYSPSSLKELPEGWRRTAFTPIDRKYRLRPAYAQGVRFAKQNIRTELPGGRWDLVLCRNLAFTYFDLPLQREVLSRLQAAIRPDGVLVIGVHERLPDGGAAFSPWSGVKGTFVNSTGYAGP